MVVSHADMDEVDVDGADVDFVVGRHSTAHALQLHPDSLEECHHLIRHRLPFEALLHHLVGHRVHAIRHKR